MTLHFQRTVACWPKSIRREIRDSVECVFTGHPLVLSKSALRRWRWLLKQIAEK